MEKNRFYSKKIKMKKTIVIMFLFLSHFTYSQSEIGIKSRYADTDTVEFSDFDQIRINEILLTMMGQAKDQSNKLIYDSLLFKAAEFHSLYLAQKSECGHTELEFPWALNPQDRIKFFINRFDEKFLNSYKYLRDNNVVESAEICCNFFQDTKITYMGLAERIMAQFGDSPNHWEIITQDMKGKAFFNAAAISFKKTNTGYQVFVVILPNYYNEKYNRNPIGILKVTKQFQQGKWDKLSKDSGFPKKDFLFTEKHYKEMLTEYEKRKRLVK